MLVAAGLGWGYGYGHFEGEVAAVGAAGHAGRCGVLRFCAVGFEFQEASVGLVECSECDWC